MTEQTNLDELLNSNNRHEAEDTFDEQPEAKQAVAEPEPEVVEKAEATAPEKAEQAASEDESDDGEDAKAGLPPWMHKRLKVKDEKLSQKEAELADAKRKLEEYERRIAAQASQPQTNQQPVSQGMQPEQDEYQRKLNASIAYAQKQFDPEEVQQALQWAQAKAAQDPDFNQLALYQPAPAQFAVQEFQKSPEYNRFKAMKELSEYGYDMQAYMAAKMAQSQQPVAGMVEAGPQSGEQPLRQQRTMPTDLQSIGTGGPRGRGYTGPTPLSALLKQK